jgi:putative toxin-antitoxin system antitoxin component (TIGR02293 family)
LDLLQASDKGVAKQALLHLADFLGLSARQMAQLLPVTERTIQRYAREQRFNPFVSEHILQIAEVAARGLEVFGDRPRFLSWLNHPSRVLALETPMSLLRSRFGAEMLLEELGRIEHGVLS